MAKKHDADGPMPLSHYWTPSDELDAGEPIACLATTYEFQAGFFEAELLPRFLGLKFDHTENEPSFVVEREEHLAQVRAAVLVDASRFDTAQSTLRWDQIPVRVPGGLLHAKVAVLWWERLVRVIVGSANVTRQGYRRNRELFAALDFWDDPESVPLSVLRDVLDFLELTLECASAAPRVGTRTKAAIDDVRQALRPWSRAPREFKPRERPRVSLAVARPKRAGSAARSALGHLLDTWGKRRATLMCVVTPFVGQDVLSGARDRVIEKMEEIPRARGCEGYLVVPELPRNSSDDMACVEIPKAVGESWCRAFTPSRAFVLPLPLCVDEVEERNRCLHAKAILLESEDDALLMIGSSNFTPHGMGIGPSNVEANLVFFDGNGKRDGILLADRLGLPLDWDDAQPVDNVKWRDPKEAPPDLPAKATLPPAFFKWATYSQESGELRLEVDVDQEEPGGWTVSLNGSTDAGAVILFSRGSRGEPLSSPILQYVVPEESRGLNIVALTIDWSDSEGQHSAKLGVCAESRESLLPPGEFRELGADAILECLISGKSPAQWFDQQQRAAGRAIKNSVGLESLRAVDTSGYLLYRVRRFGRALAAMSKRIGDTPQRADAIAYRLLKDPFGPVPLAEKILHESKRAEVDRRLEVDHCVFLLAELLRTVGLLHVQLCKDKGTRSKQRHAIADQFQEARRRLIALIDGERASSAVPLPDNLEQYIQAIHHHLENGEPVFAPEVADAS